MLTIYSLFGSDGIKRGSIFNNNLLKAFFCEEGKPRGLAFGQVTLTESGPALIGYGSGLGATFWGSGLEI